MKEPIDLNELGKQMPYTVPEGFFEEMEGKLMSEVNHTKKKKNTQRIVMWTGVAVAASLALLLALRFMSHSDKQAVDAFESVEMAFQELDEEDQEQFLQQYQNDLFLRSMHKNHNHGNNK